MPMSRSNQRTFHRHLYAGWDMTITLLKRGNDQAQGTVTSYTIGYCRRRPSMYHTGEPIQYHTASADYAEFMLPALELESVGLTALDINPGDRIKDADGYLWQIESTDTIRIRLANNYVSVLAKWVKSD